MAFVPCDLPVSGACYRLHVVDESFRDSRAGRGIIAVHHTPPGEEMGRHSPRCACCLWIYAELDVKGLAATFELFYSIDQFGTYSIG